MANLALHAHAYCVYDCAAESLLTLTRERSSQVTPHGFCQHCVIVCPLCVDIGAISVSPPQRSGPALLQQKGSAPSSPASPDSATLVIECLRGDESDRGGGGFQGLQGLGIEEQAAAEAGGGRGALGVVVSQVGGKVVVVGAPYGIGEAGKGGGGGGGGSAAAAACPAGLSAREFRVERRVVGAQEALALEEEGEGRDDKDISREGARYQDANAFRLPESTRIAVLVNGGTSSSAEIVAAGN
jgi:hypothetical protein